MGTLPDLSENCVLMDLEAKTKDDALEELARAAHPYCSHIELDSLQKVLKEREQVGSTGVGSGVAIPHGKIAGLNKIILCFGRSRAGIGFDAVDNKPVQLLVMILSPVGMAEEYLHALANVSRLLKNPENRRLLLQAVRPEEVTGLFRKVGV